MNDFEIIVVGGGHAGLEAAFASAHKGHKTLLITLNKKLMGNMPCNPSIGGSAKGIVVREIDALGGMMGKAADHHYLQMKMLNTGKGPGVQCLRSQQDKLEYPGYIQSLAIDCPNLMIIEGMVVSLLHDDSHVNGVKLKNGKEISSKAVILATGTYMESKIFRGHDVKEEGPDGQEPSKGLSPYLKSMGIDIIRLKTGTPPRIKSESIDFSKASVQPGTKGDLAFSFETTKFVPFEEQIPCHLIYTTSETHKLIREHINETSLFSGLITGAGPRYCPSIESKLINFPDKDRHQLFLEPESRYTNSIYIQGFSTSMPTNIQEEMVRTLPGFENAEFLKYAYAIEYDAIQAHEYDATLEIKKWPGLYISGQICGTSGYEEAAALGLMAGINASLKIENKAPLILRRDQAYIGVMIDDLVTKGTNEPYRLMSSRAEFRLLLRHDNADIRLTEIGYQVGLISSSRYGTFVKKMELIDQTRHILQKNYVGAKKSVNDLLESIGSVPLKGGVQAYELLKRPGIKFEHILSIVSDLQSLNLSKDVMEELEIITKFEGYITKQKREADNVRKIDEMNIPLGIDYLHMDGLRIEARQKLTLFKPLTIGQASRISGVNPCDVTILILNVKRSHGYE